MSQTFWITFLNIFLATVIKKKQRNNLRNFSTSSRLQVDHDTSPGFCPLIHSPDMMWRPSAHAGWSLSWLTPMLREPQTGRYSGTRGVGWSEEEEGYCWPIWYQTSISTHRFIPTKPHSNKPPLDTHIPFTDNKKQTHTSVIHKNKGGHERPRDCPQNKQATSALRAQILRSLFTQWDSRGRDERVNEWASKRLHLHLLPILIKRNKRDFVSVSILPLGRAKIKEASLPPLHAPPYPHPISPSTSPPPFSLPLALHLYHQHLCKH